MKVRQQTNKQTVSQDRNFTQNLHNAGPWFVLQKHSKFSLGKFDRKVRIETTRSFLNDDGS